MSCKRMTDYNGNAFLDTGNLGPRASIILDRFNDGRSKISASYGTYYESIPMSLAARYFGGEGLLIRNGVPNDLCKPTDLYSWTGNGECGAAASPPLGGMDDPRGAGTNPFNNGSNLPGAVPPAGQYHRKLSPRWSAS